jgi:hypothetical protein
MLWYFVIFAVLLALSLVEGSARSRWPGYACGVILALMMSLRYETGFDWADYEAHYLFLPAFGQTNLYVSLEMAKFEPGFELFSRVLRTLGADFQVLLFLCGVFSMFALTKLAARFSPLIGIVLLWYYGFLFLPAALGMIRQTLSVSFVYLAIISVNDGKYRRAVLLSAIALSMHYFSAAYLPIVFWRWRSPGLRISAITAVVGYAISTVGNNLFVATTDIVVSIVGGGFVADKMSIYSSFIGAQISPFSLALVAWHLAFLWIVERRYKNREYIIEAAMLSAFLAILLHSMFAPLPILWNRMMLMTFPLEAIALCRLYAPELARAGRRSLMLGTAALGSAMALAYILLNPQSLVYTPYESLAVVWVRGPYGTGRIRYQMVREENVRLFQQQKIK